MVRASRIPDPLGISESIVAWINRQRRVVFAMLAGLVLVLPKSGLSQSRPARPLVVPIPGASAYRVEANLLYRERDGRRLLLDVFTPRSEVPRHPVVIFVHGGPVPESVQGKDLGHLQSYGPFLTEAGLASVVFSHGLSGPDALQDAAGDVDAAVRFARSNAEGLGIDPDRICMVFSSAGGVFLAPFLRTRPTWLRCVVLNYAVLRPGVFEQLSPNLAVSQEQREGLDPFPYIASPGETAPSLFIAEAGRDAPPINADLARLREEAVSAGWRVEYWNHPTGPHAFDVVDPSPRSRAILMRIREFLGEHLQIN
jgi:acetyl esterase/lipase